MSRRLQVALTTLVVGLLSAVPASAHPGGGYANEAEMMATHQPHRMFFISDPGVNQRFSHAELASGPLFNFFTRGPAEARFDKNFMIWAPIRAMNLGNRKWADCPSGNNPTGHICPGPYRYLEVDHTVNNGRITVKSWGSGFIATACANFSQGGNRTGPIPEVSGVKYLDRNANGTRDSGEPGLSGWRMQLWFGNRKVDETTTASNGSYEFALNANSLPIGAGTYRVTEVQQPGFRQTQAPASFSVGHGVGDRVFSGKNFGNYRIPKVSIDDVTVDPEGDTGDVTPATFTVSLDEAVGKPITVHYATGDQTATAGADYGQASGTATIPANQTSTTVEVPVLGDDLDEFDESFEVNLSDPSDATIADGQGTGAIIDDDAPPGVSINDVTVDPEGNGGALTDAVFTVSLSSPSAKPVTVEFQTHDGSAVGPDDYQARSGTISFAPGETSKPVAVPVVGDDLDEFDETFGVVLSNPGHATVTDGEGVGTIVDDDAPPTVSIDDVTTIEGDSGTTPALFTVTLSAPSGKPVSVDFASQDGTATEPADYDAAAGTANFAPGNTAEQVQVPVRGDVVSEPDETYTVELSQLVDLDPGDLSGLGTIVDDERAGRFSCRASAVRLGSAEPFVANSPNEPCVDERHALAAYNSSHLSSVGVSATALSAETDQAPDNLDADDPAAGDHSAATADVAIASIRLGGTRISVSGLHAEAAATCDVAGAPQGPRFSAQSRVGQLTINGLPLNIGALPLSIPLGAYTLHLNATRSSGDSVVQRALWLEPRVANLPELVLAEAKADRSGNPCREKV